MNVFGNLPIFVAHGALGYWDDLALAVVGLLLLGYLAFLAIRQRRNKLNREPNALNAPKDELQGERVSPLD
ncbi:MAG TPA: hypothetical protein VKQ72_05430 [Aggregatilineales bacterium]|nr:hypothetical protein [Aggregatilineales bacterium]